MLTTMVENWPGYRDGIMGPDLMTELRAQAERFGAEIVQGDVASVDLSARPFTIQVGKTAYTADALIVATGASAKWLDLGVDKQLSGRGVSTCATCDGFFFKGKHVAVVGGGDTAMEEAIYLSKLASHVTVIHRRDTLRASKVMQDKALSTTRTSRSSGTARSSTSRTSTKGEVTGAGADRTRVTGAVSELAVDGVFIGIGHVPNTKLFKGQLDAQRERLHQDARRLAHQRAGRVRRRRRAGSRLPPGRHGRRIGLHGRDRRRALPVSGRRATEEQVTQLD